MDKDTAAALELSIDHWMRLVALAKRGSPKSFWAEGLRSDTCALCTLYISPTAKCRGLDDEEEELQDCIGCPVQNKTRKRYCEGTPYLEVYKAALLWEDAFYAKEGQPKARETLVYHCESELEFLKSLREIPQPKKVTGGGGGGPRRRWELD